MCHRANSLWTVTNSQEYKLDSMFRFLLSLTHLIKRLDSSLVEVETSLGWSLQEKCDEKSDCTSVHLVHSEEEAISAELRRFWDRKFRNTWQGFGGFRPSPYLLAATLKYHFKKYKEQYPHTFDLLNSSIYVDDLVCGQNDVPDALRTTLECLQIFSDAGMLRKWREPIRNNLICYGSKKVSKGNPLKRAIDLRPPTKVMGLAWDPEKDLIYFDPKDLLKFMSRREESKRFILSVIGRIFDPIGILGPFVIKLKCLFQDLWTLNFPQSYDTSGSSGVAKLRS
ncbi:DUF1758 domain-containing protein [Trichonephila inaurata madagascariensis]|uniref:DUF1758 domain-containing protein n=1 Tax=Trichonephila inaurata madagascariensis TaxID=2747483 RepID=A0A8X6YWU0_9ARAC|nr:DUF1758 domain-containing protein [Trichonephila inaurata madagascariensis]